MIFSSWPNIPPKIFSTSPIILSPLWNSRCQRRNRGRSSSRSSVCSQSVCSTICDLRSFWSSTLQTGCDHSVITDHLHIALVTFVNTHASELSGPVHISRCTWCSHANWSRLCVFREWTLTLSWGSPPTEIGRQMCELRSGSIQQRSFLTSSFSNFSWFFFQPLLPCNL